MGLRERNIRLHPRLRGSPWRCHRLSLASCTLDDTYPRFFPRVVGTGSLTLADRPKTGIVLQWYGYESGQHAIALLRPAKPIKPSWLLVLAENQLSPAGPWLAPKYANLDNDGLEDVAFVARGVDGCDRGPCPLFWVQLFMSRTHVLAPTDGFILLSTGTFEQKTGLPWSALDSLTWHRYRDHSTSVASPLLLHTPRHQFAA
jgi:hypothetical protein